MLDIKARAEDVAQFAEGLPSMHGALASIPGTSCNVSTHPIIQALWR